MADASPAARRETLLWECGCAPEDWIDRREFWRSANWSGGLLISVGEREPIIVVRKSTSDVRLPMRAGVLNIVDDEPMLTRLPAHQTWCTWCIEVPGVFVQPWTCNQQMKCCVDALIGLECIVTVLTRCDQCSVTSFNTWDLGSATLYTHAESYTFSIMCHWAIVFRHHDSRPSPTDLG